MEDKSPKKGASEKAQGWLGPASIILASIFATLMVLAGCPWYPEGKRQSASNLIFDLGFYLIAGSVLLAIGGVTRGGVNADWR